MKVTILAFGISKDIIGTSTITVDLEEVEYIEDFRKWLFEKYPKLGQLRSLLVAVNEEYGQANLVLNEGDEIALIPPVSGG